MTLALEMGARIAGAGLEDLSEECISAARTAIVDTVGVALLGAREPCTRIVGELSGIGEAPGPCLVLGGRRRTACLDAALVNGVAAHAADFDDLTEVFGGHPSAPVLPALLALAEEREARGPDLVTAFVVGVETETRIAQGVHMHHYRKGWHPTATLGVFGAAAACSRLLGLDAERTATALCVAVSLACGVKANFGTMTKPLHVGHATRAGLLAALLAERGFTADLSAFEGERGFLRVYNGEGRFDTERIVAPWFDPPAVLDPGISVKQFPCCGSTHPAIYAMLEIRREHEPAPGDVRGVEVYTHPLRLPHTDNPDPRSPLDAKFSMQYCVARALMHGEVTTSHFEDDAHLDAQARRLMDVTRVAAHPEMSARTERTFGAEVVVTGGDGRRLAARVDHVIGRGRDNPMSEEELHAKFADCASRVLDGAGIERFWSRARELESTPSIRSLTELLEPRPT